MKNIYNICICVCSASVIYVLGIFCFIGFCTNIAEAKTDEELHIIGVSFSNPKHPVIINPRLERIYESKIKLKNGRNEVFLNKNTAEFIIFQDVPSVEICVYKVGILSSTLPEPIYSYKQDNGIFLVRQALWVENVQSLCILGYSVNSNGKKVELLKIINFHDNTYDEKIVDLAEYLKISSKMISCSDHLLIIGYDDEELAKKNQSVNTSVIFDLSQKKIHKSDFVNMSLRVQGYFDSNLLALSNGKELFSYDLESKKYICREPDGLREIFGYDNVKNGFYSQITLNYFVAERDVIVFCPLQNANQYNILFKKKLPGNLQSTTYISESYLKDFL